MLSFADLLANRNIPPPPKVGAGRIERIQDDDLADDDRQYVCIDCGELKSSGDYYYSRRNDGYLRRISYCKACQNLRDKNRKRKGKK